MTRALIVVSFLLLAVPARAQTDARAEAAREFEEGSRAFEAGEHDAARAHFERSLELAPLDVIRFNLALSLDRLARYAEAAVQYEAVAASGDVDEDLRARARASAADMHDRTGELQIRGDVAITSVLVDDRQRCTRLPCFVELDPGPHEVVVRGEAQGAPRAVTIARGESLELELEAAAPRSTGGPAPTWLGWTAVATAGVAVAGIIGFGVLALDRHAQFEAMPSDSVRSEGIAYQLTTNLAIGLLVVAGIVFVLDLLILGQPEPRSAESLALAF